MRKFYKAFVLWVLLVGAGEAKAMVSANDTIVFDLSQAFYSNVSGVNYVEIPIRIHSTDPAINAVDWWFQFDQNELTYVSTTSAIGGFDVFSNFNMNNQYLSNSSSTASISDYLPTYTTIMRVKFSLPGGCAEIGEDDFFSITALLNGILSVGKFIGGSVSGDIALETPSPYCTNTELFFSFADSVGGRPITAYAWDFGDATSSSAQSVGHSYGNEGSYNVTLQVTNDLGCSYNYDQVVQVNPSPTAGFTSTFDEVWNINSFQSTSSISNGAIASYDWTFGDGDESTMQDPKHTYAFQGFYNVTLVVTSDLGCTSTYSEVVSCVVKVENMEAASGIGLFPNPASGELTIVNDYTGSVSIVNLLGQRVLPDVFTVNGVQTTIDVSSLAAGSYCLISWRNQEPFAKRFIVMH